MRPDFPAEHLVLQADFFYLPQSLTANTISHKESACNEKPSLQSSIFNII
jgi:hypothetical protein